VSGTTSAEVRSGKGPRASQLRGLRRRHRLGCEETGGGAGGLVAAGLVFDDQISWPTAMHSAPDLAWDNSDGYSVNRRIDGKEKVYGSIP